MIISNSEIQKLISVMERENLSVSELMALIENYRKNQIIINPSDEIKLTVDYNITVKQAIIEGKYSWSNKEIKSENFPLTPEKTGNLREITSKIFHFNRSIVSKDVISEMKKAGYRPAVLLELAALGAKHPELQLQFPIVGLGSVWHEFDEYYFVPCLNANGNGRGLSLSGFDNDFRTIDHFLGVLE